jgi:hypothetical protein
LPPGLGISMLTPSVENLAPRSTALLGVTKAPVQITAFEMTANQIHWEVVYASVRAGFL